MHTYLYAYICIPTLLISLSHTHTHTHTSRGSASCHKSVCVCMNTYVYTYICIHTLSLSHTHTHTHISWKRVLSNKCVHMYEHLSTHTIGCFLYFFVIFCYFLYFFCMHTHIFLYGHTHTTGLSRCEDVWGNHCRSESLTFSAPWSAPIYTQKKK